MKTRLHVINFAVIFGALLYVAAPARGQETVPTAPDTAAATAGETYRFRVENAQYGRIELSVDGGEHFLLIGRVLKPATVTAPEKTVERPGTVIRSSSEGIAVAVTADQIVKILPSTGAPARGKIPDSAIVTNIKPRTSIFAGYCPPVGTSALQQAAGGVWKAFSDGYSLSENDMLGFVVVLPETHGVGNATPPTPDPAFLARLAEVRKQLVALSDQYMGLAIARARENNRSVVSGIVTLRAKLPSGEPEPITAVTYCIDGDVVSAQNVFPSAFGWNTTRAANGEHVVEIRALSKYGTVITRVRTLVVVNNP